MGIGGQQGQAGETEQVKGQTEAEQGVVAENGVGKEKAGGEDQQGGDVAVPRGLQAKARGPPSPLQDSCHKGRGQEEGLALYIDFREVLAPLYEAEDIEV